MKTVACGLALGGVLISSPVFAQNVECSSPDPLQEIQRVLQQRFAPPAIDSIQAIARGQPTPSASVQITGIETLSQNQNIQKCAVSAQIWRTDLRQPIKATVQYTIYNRSMVGGFHVTESN